MGEKNGRLIHGQVPLRVNDIGGWTDTWFAGWGRVLNLAVGPPVEIQVKAKREPAKKKKRVTIVAENYGTRFSFDPDNPSSSPHPLLQQAVNLAGVPGELSIEITLFSPLAPGMSAGTSAAVAVAVIGALSHLKGELLSPKKLASLAQRVETERLQQQCGIQDQLCAAFGGPLFIQMDKYPQSEVKKLRIDPKTAVELNRRLALIYLGRPHLSTSLHETIIKRLEKGEASFRPLRKMAELAEEARQVLLNGDLETFGKIMVENNEWQRRLGPDLIPAEADQVIGLAKKYRASGWKVNGAGGPGGSLTILGSEDDRLRREMLTAVKKLGHGIVPVPVYLCPDGFRAWEIA